eukprot:147306-Amphidinium_carterae.1
MPSPRQQSNQATARGWEASDCRSSCWWLDRWHTVYLSLPLHAQLPTFSSARGVVESHWPPTLACMLTLPS